MLKCDQTRQRASLPARQPANPFASQPNQLSSPGSYSTHIHVATVTTDRCTYRRACCALVLAGPWAFPFMPEVAPPSPSGRSVRLCLVPARASLPPCHPATLPPAQLASPRLASPPLAALPPPFTHSPPPARASFFPSLSSSSHHPDTPHTTTISPRQLASFVWSTTRRSSTALS